MVCPIRDEKSGSSRTSYEVRRMIARIVSPATVSVPAALRSVVRASWAAIVGGTTWAGRYGRGVARQAPAIGAPGGDQADSPLAHGQRDGTARWARRRDARPPHRTVPAEQVIHLLPP